MPATYEDTIIPGIEPTIERQYLDGEKFRFTGDRAMAMADTPGAAKWRAENPELALRNAHSPFDDPAETSPAAHAIGQFINNQKSSKGLIGSILDKGMLPGAMVGGVLGLGGGALASLLAKLFLGKASTKNWALAGGALGAVLGGHNGLVRSRMHSPEQFLKSAATYTDPRNFILEKLQSATDVGIGEKVRLAAAVRNLDRSDAERLASLVRAALGFGVGAIIAKFIFGTTSAAGTLFGGIVGALGTSMIANNLFGQSTSPTFDFNFKPLSYRDIL